MSKLKIVGIVVGVIFALVVVIGGLIFYSYSLVSVSLNDVAYHSIDWVDFSFSTLAKLGLDVLTGNWLAGAFDLIEGINLNLFFEITNNGLFAIYIPDLSYDLLVNGIEVGKGKTSINKAVFPGESIEIKAFQNFKKSTLNPAVSSIVNKNGIMEITVNGTAYLQFFGLTLPIPFESSEEISVYDKIKEKISGKTSNKQNYKNSAILTMRLSDAFVNEGEIVTISGKLTDSRGYGIPNALIYIKDEDTGSGDDKITTVTTNHRGEYNVHWKSESKDPFDSIVEIYAIFEGNSNYDKARSSQINVRVN